MKINMLFVISLTLLSTPTPQLLTSSLGTAFTYQGRLSSGTNVANGVFDFSFALYDAATKGGQVGSSLTTNALPVSNGYFSVTLDFGNAFDGSARWLDISVKTNGADSYTQLAPRQPLTPVPYTLMAASASNFLGTVQVAQLPAVVLTNNQSGVTLNGLTTVSNLLVTGTSFVNYLVVTNLPVFNGSGIATNGGSGTNNLLTHPTFRDSASPYSIVITNGTQVGFTDYHSNDLFMVFNFPNGTNYGRIRFINSVNGESIDLFALMNHTIWRNGYAPEGILTTSGSLALGARQGDQPGYPYHPYGACPQIGIAGGGWLNQFALLQYNSIVGTNLLVGLVFTNGVWTNLGSATVQTNYLGDANPLVAQWFYWSNGASVDVFSGFRPMALDTNGTGGYVGYASMPGSVSDQWHPDYSGPGVAIRTAGRTGVDVVGTLNMSKALGTAGSSLGLDFSTHNIQDFTVSGSSVALSTVNDVPAYTGVTSGAREFILRAGALSSSITAPPGWSGWTATNISPGKMLYLRLLSVGPGESNKLVTSEIVM